MPINARNDSGTRLLRNVHIVWLAPALALFVMGCPDTYAPDERSSDDQARTGAQAMPLRTPVTDAVNYEGGDATDWKAFNAPGAGQMTIEVFFDNHYIDSSVSLYDSYGTRLDSTSRAAGSDPAVIVYEVPEAGPYYIRIQANQNNSVYSVRVYPGTPREGSEPEVDPRPVFDRPI